MVIFKGFVQNSVSLLERAQFSSHLVVGIYVENCVRTGNIHSSRLFNYYAQEKGYCELLASLSMFLCPFTREHERITQVGVEPAQSRLLFLDAYNHLDVLT